MEIRKINKLVLASSNPKKIREFMDIFSKKNIHIIPQSKFGIDTVNEKHITFVENAIEKARHVTRLTNLPTIAEDSGLCVDALDNYPGIFSARYSSLEKQNRDISNNNLLIKNLTNIDNRKAYYISIIVFLRNPNDPTPIISEGKLYGEIVNEPSGTNGFGYDPHFYMPEFGKTVASMSMDEKNLISHRSIAINKLIDNIMNK
ncbi:nucleoside-triphosphatase [Candidatus Kinetoplastibacterium blastocrithidii TCC012E]|uniref:dITP/XTP pyrophosphatase n=1 Tax=Candidatus Kinetoplastidibacterium blastocrithidiae TCC012E TaxID=1208922 RepID=M1M3U9_9PROT|nr:RdgB/HAM1 family non-canonical purine NTP pyrophosphatase [Candidatus Kinetoplastibacterium blastocrithidii]AFZ83662.1 nucleoside-triphosphatase [Candidatus Kinetoplastibacterium blastocrithidii (ex Strigomonas culicis)]AGF49784.1 nucleoside-triphosphatase [Candidatus Kinetoplastibacterium blastocrithidii TCC012E]